MISELYIRHALEMTIALPAAVIAFLPARKNLRFSLPWTLAMTGGFLIAFILLGAAACVRFHVETSFVLLPLLLLCLEVFILLVNGHTTKKLFCFMNAAMLCSFSTVYAVFLTAPEEPEEGPFTIRSACICLLVTCLLIVFFYKTLMVKLPYLLAEERLNRSWGTISLILFALCVMFYYINPISLAPIRTGRVRSVALIALLLYPLAIYALYHLYWWTSVRLNENARVKQENVVLNMEQKRYEELRTYMDETRTLRHDFRQHMRVITELAAEDEFEELKEYIKQFSGIVKKSYTPFSANMAVDAVAAHYSNMAKAQNVKIEWNLKLPKNLPIPDVDFCALLGNLMENAMNATIKLPEEKRRIVVMASMISENMLGLTVDNPYTGKIRFNREHLPTTREPGHGFGMPSVAATVNRYNGTMEIETKDGLFSVSIMLYPQTQKAAGIEEVHAAVS